MLYFLSHLTVNFDASFNKRISMTVFLQVIEKALQQKKALSTTNIAFSSERELILSGKFFRIHI